MSRITDRVRVLTGAQDEESAQRTTRAVIAVVLEALPLQDRAWLRRLLPGGLTEEPASPAGPPAATAMGFYTRVAARESVELGFAIEHAQSVCRVLAEMLHDDELRHLTSRLAPGIAALFSVPEQQPMQPMESTHARPQPSHHTLAEGSPGSRRPLSEAAPERGQGESVAGSDNPHSDTKLSSARGTTQEREAETLANKQPGAQEAETLAAYRPPRRT